MRRIKSISSLPFVSPSPNSTENPRLTVLLTSVSSDGLVNLYDLEMFLRTEPKGFEARQASPIASYDTKGSRLTCVFLADGKSSIVRQVSNGAVNCHIHPEHGSTGKADGTKEGESEDDYSSEDPYDSGEEAEDIQTEN